MTGLFSDVPGLGDFFSAQAILAVAGWTVMAFLGIQGLATRHQWRSGFYGLACTILALVTWWQVAAQHRDATQSLSFIQGSKSYFIATATASDGGPPFSLVITNPDNDLPIFDAAMTVSRVPPQLDTQGMIEERNSTVALNIGIISPGTVQIARGAIGYGGYFITMTTRFALFKEYLAIGTANGALAEKYQITDRDGKPLATRSAPKDFTCDCPNWKF